MDVLQIALIVLAIVGIWAVTELTLTIRKTRSTIEDLGSQISTITEGANAALDQLQPTIVKIDDMVTELEPAVQEVQPLLEKANTAIDVVTVDLASVNDILVDVSSVTDTASNVTSTVSKAANSAVSGVAGVVGKFTSGKSSRRRKLADKSVEADEMAVEPEAVPFVEEEADEVEEPKTYFTYGSESE